LPLTPKHFFSKKKKKEKIAALTAYDFPFAKILDKSGIDLILVGDSLGMVLLGHETTLPVTMDDMVHHTAAAARGVKNALLAADLPYQSYKTPALAVKNAKLLMKAGAKAVKLEGGKKAAAQIKALVKAGIPVIGHLGMMPQSVQEFGGYKVQGKDHKQAETIFNDALLIEKLGVFAIVLECVPANLAAMITRYVKCPTIGIGGGPETDGQILVLHDMLGFESSVKPRFVRKYAALDEEVSRAVSDYKKDVLSGHFPLKEESY
jgi:3-methyl-2-oxobutanoate hydroxymethyltransferase